MRHRGRNRSASSNLDSLLDTMTNVVGILVIVLIMTQVNVADAIRRLRSALPEVSEEQMEELVEQASSIDEELLFLESPDQLDVTRIEEVQGKINMLKVKLEKEKEDVRPEDDLIEVIAARDKSIADQSRAVEALEKKLSGLRVELEKFTLLANKDPVSVRLPDPRPARGDASEVLMACSGDRVYIIDVASLQLTAKKQLEGAGRRIIHMIEGIGDKRRTIYKRKASEDFILAQNTGNKMAKVQLRTYPERSHGTLIISPRPNAGEKIEEIRKSDRGLVRATMQQAFLDRDYVYFYVAPDAFATYLEARRIAEVDHNLPVGWEFTDQNMRIYKGAPGLRFEHTPLPPPTNPAPKPKPKPQPGKPNVLD